MSQQIMPRTGVSGLWDRLIGPGATNGELALLSMGSIGGTVFVLLNALTRQLEWNALQYLIALFLAFDLFGGVIANATPSAKRWYHREGQTATHHLVFVAIHIVQLLMVLFFFRPNHWIFLAVSYSYLLVASCFILWMPVKLQRPSAYLAFMGGLLISQSLIAPIPGLEWFLPVFYLKLLVSHLLGEDVPDLR
jgi:hypothetical protein